MHGRNNSSFPSRNFRLTIGLAALCLVMAVSQRAVASDEGSFQRELKVTGAVNLDVDTGSGNITVTTGASGVVRISGHIRTNNWFESGSIDRIRQLEQHPPIEQNGNTIRVGRVEDSELRRHVSISYELTVPVETQLRSKTGSGNVRIEGTKESVDAESGSGSLEIRRIGSSVHAQTGSGSITLEDIQGTAKAHTGSGTIHAMRISAGFDGDTGSGGIDLQETGPGAVRAEAGSGNVTLRGIAGALDAQSGSGNIEAEGKPEGRWLVHTGSGSVRLQMPQETAFELNAHTGSGSIHSNHEVTVQGSIGHHDLRGKVRGGGVPVEVQTGSGNINID